MNRLQFLCIGAAMLAATALTGGACAAQPDRPSHEISLQRSSDEHAVTIVRNVDVQIDLTVMDADVKFAVYQGAPINTAPDIVDVKTSLKPSTAPTRLVRGPNHWRQDRPPLI